MANGRRFGRKRRKSDSERQRSAEQAVGADRRTASRARRERTCDYALATRMSRQRAAAQRQRWASTENKNESPNRKEA